MGKEALQGQEHPARTTKTCPGSPRASWRVRMCGGKGGHGPSSARSSPTSLFGDESPMGCCCPVSCCCPLPHPPKARTVLSCTVWWSLGRCHGLWCACVLGGKGGVSQASKRQSAASVISILYILGPARGQASLPPLPSPTRLFPGHSMHTPPPPHHHNHHRPLNVRLLGRALYGLFNKQTSCP